MRVHGGRQWRRVPREPLRQKEVPRHPVHGRYGCVPCGMKRVQPIESSLLLPRPPRELNTSLRDSDAGLIAEEGIIGCGSLPTTTLVGPEVPELLDQGIRQEHVPGPASLG